MRPFAEFPLSARGAIRMVLTDIDDTLTDAGRLPAASLACLERLSEAGLVVIPVTGRPAGWCDHIARMWPVDAVIGENGAFYLAYDHERRVMRSSWFKEAPERARDRGRLEQLRERILAEVPGAGVASDQAYRAADLAIDFCEDVEPIGPAAVRRIVELFEEAGATAKVSSIHVNGWFGDYDKLAMARRCLADLFAVDISRDNAAIVFAGDSPNDAPMFAHFEHSVGVANVRDHDLGASPAWVTEQRSARGFAELTEGLLAALESRR